MNRRSIGGKKAKNMGASFEAFFQAFTLSQGLVCTRIPDGCKQVGKGGRNLVRTTTPFDFLIAANGIAAALDLKTIDEKTFPYSLIKQHQRKSLMDIGRHMVAGYLIWFRPLDRVVFFDHREIWLCASGSSLKPDEGFEIGPLNDMDPFAILESYGPSERPQGQSSIDTLPFD